ncbi:MAG TPA: hypothetical protein VFV34_12585 [Blastocatellia bacterium]|nr:hypothetical protein [Blastocatellia bacterium]
MLPNKAGIFRAEALRHYLDRKEKPALLRLIKPNTFFFLWVLMGLLLGGIFLVLHTEFPIYAQAVAVVVDEGDGPGEPSLLIFLSPEELPRLRVGERAFVGLSGGKRRVVSTITAVEPRILSPKEVERRYHLGTFAASKVNEAKSVALVKLSAPPDDWTTSSYVGSFYEAEVEVGRRRGYSLFRLSSN